MINQIDFSTKKQMVIPFDETMINQSFIELPDENYVIAIKPNITAVVKYFEKGGEPVIDPITKKPCYHINNNISIQLLSREEYQSILEATRRKLLK